MNHALKVAVNRSTDQVVNHALKVAVNRATDWAVHLVPLFTLLLLPLSPRLPAVIKIQKTTLLYMLV